MKLSKMCVGGGGCCTLTSRVRNLEACFLEVCLVLIQSWPTQEFDSLSLGYHDGLIAKNELFPCVAFQVYTIIPSECVQFWGLSTSGSCH